MKSKVLVALGSLALAILIVCVSVYAFNAHCTANEAACRTTSSGNGWGLFNGSYALRAQVGDDLQHKAGGFVNGQDFSDSAIADKDDGDCSAGDGSASASVSGLDAQGNIHHKNDSANF